LLDRLEKNRLSLYLRVLELQDEKERDLKEAYLRLRDVQAENRALWARTAELEGRIRGLSLSLDTLRNELDALVRSRAFALAERLSRLRTRSGGGPGLSRQRLREILDREKWV
jgi:predicted nuclease with TOPRIM domain